MAELSGRANILVAEDELLLALDLQAMLQHAGYAVIGPARSLAAVKDRIAAHPDIALALLDLNLAGESAVPLARALLQGGTPVILTTGYDAHDVPDDLNGAHIYVKPVSSAALLRAIAALLAQNAR